MNELEEIEDTLLAYEFKRYPPMKVERCKEVWSPTMTEQQKQELDEYIKKHNCPF